MKQPVEQDRVPLGIAQQNSLIMQPASFYKTTRKCQFVTLVMVCRATASINMQRATIIYNTLSLIWKFRCLGVLKELALLDTHGYHIVCSGS